MALMTAASPEIEPRDLHQAWDDADALVAEGALVEAIAVLTEAVRHQRDPRTEQRIVRLRHDAFALLDRTAGREPWPPPLADPFPEVVDRPPEITPDQLTVDTLGGGILHHGCLVVRGLLPPASAERVARDIDATFADREVQLDPPPGPERPPATWYRPFKPGPDYPPFPPGRRRWVREGGAVWAADAPRVMFDVLEDFGRSGLVEVIAEYFGERPALSVNKSTLRKVEPGTAPAWHQDGAFLGEGVRAVNIWIALTACGAGTDAPGLDILPRRLDAIAETGTGGAHIQMEVGPRVVEQVAEGTPVLRPRFEAGDALLFDEMFLHSTAPSEELTRHRHAIEWWCFAPSAFPPDYIPMAL
jgi:hypothetical protein